MGILYQVTSLNGWAIWLFVLFALMAFNLICPSLSFGHGAPKKSYH